MARIDPPTNVVASDGTADTVFITWDGSVGATVYVVYRSTIYLDQGYIIGITDELEWNDTTTVSGRIYWYGIIARGDTCSVLSLQDSGYTSSTTPTVDVPPVPTGLMAVVI